MWIAQIRLKNIKSYGAGPDGDGIYIQLEPGVNQIAGKNGVGKSTLIEAIGYALFDAEPVVRLAKNTYLLRNGCKSGEIDVWVWHQDCLYRVERDVGAGARRWKVVRQDDDFIEAEGDQEVKAFMAKLTGVDRPERLADVFHSLLGVKQGRFTLPFDLTPRDAKNHFDPLLDVDIFRQCFDYLKEPCDGIRQDMANLRNIISGLDGQITQLQDAPGKLEESIRQQATLELLVDKCQQQLNTASGILQQHQQLMKKWQAAQLKVSEARGQLERGQSDLQTAAARVAESRSAQQVLAETAAHYRQYLQVEQLIQQLEQQRQTRDRLVQSLTARQKEETGLTRDWQAKTDQAARDRAQAARKNEEYQARLTAWQQHRKEFQAGEEQCLALRERAEKLKSCMIQVVQWLKSMSTLNHQAIGQLADLQANLDHIDQRVPEQLALAQAALEQAERDEQECRGRLERTRQEQLTLQKQLAQLSTGLCPLLGTGCAQFNPDTARQDLARLTDKVKEIEREHRQKLTALAQAKGELEKLQRVEKEQLRLVTEARQQAAHISKSYHLMEDAAARSACEVLGLELQGLRPDLPQLPGIPETAEITPAPYQTAVDQMKELFNRVLGYHRQWQPAVEELLQQARETENFRAGCRQELAAEEKALQSLAKDIKTLLQNAREAEQQAADIKQAIDKTREQIKALEEQLKPFAELDQQLARAGQERTRYQPGYTRYLQNLPVAEQLAQRVKQLDSCQKQLADLERELAAAEEALSQAAAAYNQAEHQQAQEEYAKANLALGEARSKWEEAKRAVVEQQRRVQTLDRLSKQRTEQMQELIRLQAQEKILEKARQTLKHAQEAVARDLTARVAAQAQIIYNAISQEAAQFNWRSSDYTLTVANVSGEKRFASLSGGQQMKAALAMQLALVKEFSAAGFCAFDEPTYGLDADSKTMLAEVIAKVQAECRFEQLLLVSHDNSFDDKVEHALNLQYSPVEGTKL